MALLGHPGKFTYCLAEDEENSPFEPLSTWLGFADEQSVVTVVGAEAPQSVLFISDPDRPDNAKLLLSILAAGFTRPGTNNSVLRGSAGLYSMIMPTWCVGPHRNSAVSLPIETGQMCEIP